MRKWIVGISASTFLLGLTSVSPGTSFRACAQDGSLCGRVGELGNGGILRVDGNHSEARAVHLLRL